MIRARRLLPLILLCLPRFVFAAEPAPLPTFDFRQEGVIAQWRPAHDVGEARATPEGMEITASGDDPFLVGPALDLPEGAPLAVELRVRSERGGVVEVFYFADHARAGHSVSAAVPPGKWEDVRLPLPPLGKRVTFRIDPPAVKGGRATIASMAVSRRMLVKEPAWPQPLAELGPGNHRLTVRSGSLTLVHDGAVPGRFEVSVDGIPMAASLARSMVGYVEDGEPRWVALPESGKVEADDGGIKETFQVPAREGGALHVERKYSAGSVPGSISVETMFASDRGCELLFAPALVLLPGASAGGSGFGARKTQALLAGLEYLGPDDASSAEADVIGPASKRRVPDSLKLTIPLMAVCAEGKYLALAWEDGPAVSALFDSPDRTFGAAGHVMGLLLPGSDGRHRIEGSLIPEVPYPLKGGERIVVRATLLGGAGRSAVPAIRQYVSLAGLPPAPSTNVDAQAYFRWAAGGWLDSKIREGSLVRHAVWPGFGAQPAADAAVSMRWLAAQTDDAALARRLTKTAATVAAAVPADRYDFAAVSHVRDPVASLVLGHTLENARAADAQARNLLTRFESDGAWRFRREAGKDDFARTSPQPNSNGLTATHVSRLLDLAAVSGKQDLIDSSIRLLHGLDRYADDVPRGAQSWEVPLHTPDVLASAWLVRAYVTGYALAGDARLLESARYWAWTGVPFVYLRRPADGPVGLYATIAVYGATNWTQPVWFGQPVQWCGLVYADALYRLAQHDTSGPWTRIADGITASGIQQSWPPTDAQRQGLLPDLYHLRAQTPDGPAINPGTLQADAIRLFNGPRLYDMHWFAKAGWVVHAPGMIEPVAEQEDAVKFRVRGWPNEPYQAMVGGLGDAPEVRVNGAISAGTFDAEGGRLAVDLRGTCEVELRRKGNRLRRL